ncbi:uncharacterized protein LOC118552561 [Halichoerus grypus]
MRGPVQPRTFRPRSACQPGGTDYQRFCSGIGKGPLMSHLSLEQRTQEGFELNTRQDFSIMRDVRPQRGRPSWDLPIQESPRMRFLRPRGVKWLLKPTRPVRTTPRTGISVFGLKSSTVSTVNSTLLLFASPSERSRAFCLAGVLPRHPLLQLLPLAASPTEPQLSPPADAWLQIHGVGSSAPTSSSAPPSRSHPDARCTWLLCTLRPSCLGRNPAER